MKTIFVIPVFGLIGVVLCAESSKEIRHISHTTYAKQVPGCSCGQNVPSKPSCGCNEPPHPPEEPCNSKCDDPCDDCEEPHVFTKTFSKVYLTQMHESAELQCTERSYFNKLVFDGYAETNLTCNGLDVQKGGFSPGAYTGINYERNGLISELVIDYSEYELITTFTNGNSRRLEEGKITGGHCDGDSLLSISSWLSDNPLTGCCNEGVRHHRGTNYKLNIYGKCCSECYLVSAAQSWDSPIKD